MKDFGTSDDPRVQAQLDRLAQLSLPKGRIGLDTIGLLLGRLGNPQRKLPPVFHVAGTNGKGSTCAFLRAILEADGKTVHVTTSPHLVRYNERIRIAGNLIEDDALAPLLEEVLDAGEDPGPSFFEVTIAAAFLAFSRTPADACIVEVGLGGRFDATNILEPDAVAVSGIAALGIDHERFLLAPEDGVPEKPLHRIAFEKAGILKKDTPFAVQPLAEDVYAIVTAQAASVGAGPCCDWEIVRTQNGFEYCDSSGRLDSLPKPALPGDCQMSNAGLAIAMLRASSIKPSVDAVMAGLQNAVWPARMQNFSEGKLGDIDSGFDFWLDGGHNLDAARAVREAFQNDGRLSKIMSGPVKVNVVMGMLENKDAEGFIREIAPITRRLVAIPIPGHDHHAPARLAKIAARAGIANCAEAASVIDALHLLNTGRPNDEWQPTAFLGSLYLAGEVLRLNGTLPE